MYAKQLHSAWLAAGREMIVKHQGFLAQETLLAELSPEEAAQFMPTSAIPRYYSYASSMKLLDKIILRLKPIVPEGYFELGRFVIRRRAQGLFKLAIEVFFPTSFLFKVFQRTWRSLFGNGEIVWEYVPETHQASLVIRNHPGLSPQEVEMSRGFITGVLESMAANHIQVVLQSSAPVWVFHMTWDFEK